jgi:hypothetical protein
MGMLGGSAVVDRQHGHPRLGHISSNGPVIEGNASGDHSAAVKINEGSTARVAGGPGGRIPAARDVRAVIRGKGEVSAGDLSMLRELALEPGESSIAEGAHSFPVTAAKGGRCRTVR